jgi:hypothetical protein
MPLTKIYQQSLAQGKFPSVWKNANVIPLYKGKGDSSLPSSYRPISLCICLGKLLEKVVVEQLTKQINNVRPLSRSQYGFRSGRSTVGNLLACDAVITNYVDKGAPYDIISFDFKRAFDKVPHHLLLRSLGQLHLHPITMSWFATFFRAGRNVLSLMD